MRGKKAKAIRKKVYGEMSQRVKEYKEGHEPRMMTTKGEKNPVTQMLWFYSNPTCILTGLRRKYKDIKKMVQRISRTHMLPA